MHWSFLVATLAPLLAALAITASVALRPSGNAAGAIARVGIGAGLIAALVGTIDVARSGSQTIELVAGMAIHADRTGAVLVLLVAAVSVVVQSFARRSLDRDPGAPRFFALANLLSATTMLVAVAANAWVVVAAWVASGLTLSAMVDHHRSAASLRARRHGSAAARRVRTAFLIGDAALVLAIGVALLTVGDLRLDTLDASALSDQQIIGPLSLTTLLAIALVIAGAARSSLVPFHRWLPDTLAAPTPVSAMLHAGVVNGAGVLLIRFAPVAVLSTIALSLVFVLGLVTAVWATSVMLVRSDVKGGLVYSTAGQMGFMALQIGVGAFAAALFHIVGHAMYKAAAFLGAGHSITAAAEHRHLPHRASTVSTPARVATAVVAPALAMAGALLVIDPHLTAASTMLVALFGWMSAATALHRWLATPAFSTATTFAIGVATSALTVTGYVGGLALFEGFVAATLPFEVPTAVGPVWVAAAIAAIAAAALVLRFSNNLLVVRQRRLLYVGLVSSGYERSAPATTPDQPEWRRGRTGLRISLNQG